MHVVQLEPDDKDNCKSEMRSDMISTDSRYKFFGPECETLQAVNPRTGTQFDVFHLVLFTRRDWSFYFWNVYLPVFLLTMLGM